MKYFELKKIDKLCFSYEDIARTLGITAESAQVSANRYVRQGLLIRLKRNIYLLSENWPNLTREQRFSLANILQTPSYISLMSALDYYGITTQIQQDFIESIGIQRSYEQKIEQMTFNFSKIKRNLYFGFSRVADCFIAAPEKAFIDAVYLTTLGRYSIDMASLDLNKLDFEKLKKLAENYPQNTQRRLYEFGYS